MAIGTLTTGELTAAEEAATYLVDLHKRLGVMPPETFIKLETFRNDLRTEMEDRDMKERRSRVAEAAAASERMTA